MDNRLAQIALNKPKKTQESIACVAVTRTLRKVGVTGEGGDITREVVRVRVKLGQNSVPLDAVLGFQATVLEVAPDYVEEAKERLEHAIVTGKLNPAIALVEYRKSQLAIMRKMRMKL